MSTTRFYMWWGGSSAPARFLVPLLPLLAPPIAVAVDRLRTVAGRATVLAVLAASVGIAVACVASPGGDLLFNDPHGTSQLLQAIQASAPLDVSLPTFTEAQWIAPLGTLTLWLAAGLAAVGVTVGAVRRRVVHSGFAIVTTAALAFVACSSVLVRADSAAERSAVVDRGRLSLIQEFDAASLRAVSPDRLHRLSRADLSAALTIEHRELPDRPVLLPEGQYEARISFDGSGQLAGEARVSIGDRLVLGRTATPLATPAVLRFTLIVPSPVSIGVTDPSMASRVRLVQLIPLALAAGADRSGVDVRAIEPVAGRTGSYVAYIGDGSYPEDGVFWTRGTDTAQLFVVPSGGGVLRLILHVGPTGGRVTIRAGAGESVIDLAENETRETSVALLPGAPRVGLDVRSSRAFRPSEVDKGSNDQRSLGVQVRPRVE